MIMNDGFIGQPVRSLQTMLRVIAEANYQQPTVIPDGIFGQETMLAVSSFQKQNALPVTGSVDQETWERIVTQYEEAYILIGKAEPIEIIFEPSKVFEDNEYSPYIYLLQGMLMFLSEVHPAIRTPGNSGTLDEETSKAIEEFQIIADLPVTGKLDRKTWKLLVNHFTLSANHFHGSI